MFIWLLPIILIFVFSVLPFTMLRRVLRFKHPVRLSLRQAADKKAPMDDSSKEYASEGAQDPTSPRDFGEYCTGGNPSSGSLYGKGFENVNGADPGHGYTPVSFENAMQEFASELIQPSPGYGEHSIGNEQPSAPSYGKDMGPGSEGLSDAFFDEGRVQSDSSEQPGPHAKTHRTANTLRPMAALSAFSKEDWRLAFVLSTILGPPVGRIRN